MKGSEETGEQSGSRMTCQEIIPVVQVRALGGVGTGQGSGGGRVIQIGMLCTK